MSAYLVEDITINRIISFLQNDNDSFWPQSILHSAGFIMTEQELGQAMFNLNCLSLDELYGENASKDFGSERLYKFRNEFCSRIQAFKSLDCYLYQSCEGKAEDSALYKALDQIRSAWAEIIVRRLPEYEKAQWK